jgi:hypothetical protein
MQHIRRVALLTGVFAVLGAPVGSAAAMLQRLPQEKSPLMISIHGPMGGGGGGGGFQGGGGFGAGAAIGALLGGIANQPAAPAYQPPPDYSYQPAFNPAYQPAYPPPAYQPPDYSSQPTYQQSPADTAQPVYEPPSRASVGAALSAGAGPAAPGAYQAAQQQLPAAANQTLDTTAAATPPPDNRTVAEIVAAQPKANPPAQPSDVDLRVERAALQAEIRAFAVAVRLYERSPLDVDERNAAWRAAMDRFHRRQKIDDELSGRHRGKFMKKVMDDLFK